MTPPQKDTGEVQDRWTLFHEMRPSARWIGAGRRASGPPWPSPWTPLRLECREWRTALCGGGSYGAALWIRVACPASAFRFFDPFEPPAPHEWPHLELIGFGWSAANERASSFVHTVAPETILERLADFDDQWCSSSRVDAFFIAEPTADCAVPGPAAEHHIRDLLKPGGLQDCSLAPPLSRVARR